ncbi:MAG: DUF4238 domain-containing protein [Bacteroidales bacterium]
MSKPRKHHYVPQTYLQYFSALQTKSGYIYVYDKTHNRKFKANIKDIAEERDFYRIHGKSDEYYWEKHYSENIESKYPHIIGTLDAICNLSTNNTIILTEKLQRDLANLICSQLLRTKKTRELMIMPTKAAGEKKLELLKNAMPPQLSKEQNEVLNNFQLTDNLLNDLSLEVINNEDRIKMFSKHLLEKVWVIYHNKIFNKSPFVTSDHPVCFYNMLSKNTDFTDNGLSVPETAIFFPATRKVLIALYNRNLFFDVMESYDRMVVEVDERKFVESMNAMQYKQCYRQVYSSL